MADHPRSAADWTAIEFKSATKDIPNSKKIAVPLNIKHRDGNYTQPKDRLPLPIKTGLVNLNYWENGRSKLMMLKT